MSIALVEVQVLFAAPFEYIELRRVGREVRHSSAKAARRERYPYVPPYFYTSLAGTLCVFCGNSRKVYGIFLFRSLLLAMNNLT